MAVPGLLMMPSKTQEDEARAKPCVWPGEFPQGRERKTQAGRKPRGGCPEAGPQASWLVACGQLTSAAPAQHSAAPSAFQLGGAGLRPALQSWRYPIGPSIRSSRSERPYWTAPSMTPHIMGPPPTSGARPSSMTPRMWSLRPHSTAGKQRPVT